jgi:hypothetical protein
MAADSAWGDITDILAPEDAVVALISSFFDESFDDGLLCVAGYAFTKLRGRRLDEEWRRMLARHRIPYFRMSACNAGEEPFDGHTKPECVAAQTDAIALINKHASFGYAVTVDQRNFSKVLEKNPFVSTPYELAVWFCLMAVREWRLEAGQTGGAAYFFEAGHQHAGLADKLMRRLFNDPTLRSFYDYRAHAFVDKVTVRPVQTADVLAWQRYKDIKRRESGLTRPRADCAALMSKPRTFTLDVTEERLEELLVLIDAAVAGKITPAAKRLLA